MSALPFISMRVLAPLGLIALVVSCTSEVRQFDSASSGARGGATSSGEAVGGGTGGLGAGGSGAVGGSGAGQNGGSGAAATGGQSSSSAGGQGGVVGIGGNSNCIAGAPCTIDLQACSEDQKNDAWKGQTSLMGVLELEYYGSHKGWACLAQLRAGSQSWPVIPEPGWWCGTVVETCTCSPEDGCE
jgi:hypothetical protein